MIRFNVDKRGSVSPDSINCTVRKNAIHDPRRDSNHRHSRALPGAAFVENDLPAVAAFTGCPDDFHNFRSIKPMIRHIETGELRRHPAPVGRPGCLF